MIGRVLLASTLIAIAAQAQAEAPQPGVRSCDRTLCIEFADLTPKFLAFEETARNEPDAEKRFAIWQEKYGFAAVPPGPKGQEMARRLLDAGWPRYAASIPSIREGAARMPQDALVTLRQVADLLGLDEPIDVRVVGYVGAFEDNAFTSGSSERPAVFFPVETSTAAIHLIQPHELTHAVHLRTARLSGGWERSIAQTIFQEGLAMRATEALRPNASPEEIVSHRAGWLADATARKTAILSDVLPMLDRKDGETVWRYTVDTGPAGIEREAYAAGWFVIGHLRDKGMSFAQIARIPEGDMAPVVRTAIAEMTAR